MRISAKGRYALAAMINLAQNYNSGEYISVLSISEELGISKIYLEQVFSLLKRGQLVISLKGTQGGYRLAKKPRGISVFDILSSVELALFEKTAATCAANAPEIEAAMNAAAFEVLDKAIKSTLENITLFNLINQAEKQKKDDTLMFYI